MSEEDLEQRADARIHAWVNEAGPLQGADDPLLDLLAKAQRAAGTPLPADESAKLWERVRSRTIARPAGRRPRTLRWIAAALAAVALGLYLAGLSSAPSPPGRGDAPPGTLVKELRFESVQQGKVVRLEMSLYRTEEE